MCNVHQTKSLLTSLALASAVVFAGCDKPDSQTFEKAPRPVSVMALEMGVPQTSRQVSASVGSWKTEQIGFEVAGRVRWVLEPGEEIEGRVFDSQGNVVTPGTALAQVDPERYELALETAKAQVSVAELERASIEVNLKSGIPADLEAARAELELAQVEYDRNRRLVSQNAISQSDFDKSAAQLRTARARISTLDAQSKQAQAQLQSAVASIRQAQQNLKDAQRNLDDATLYSSFRGQVADVQVVPGSVVAQGSPVLTVQMMNPIKIEVELSAELSRTIRKRHHLPISITMPDGSTIVQEGFVYKISPTADTSTRTFTMTLLVLNRKIAEALPDELADKSVARTSDVWRMDLDFLPDAPKGTYYIEKNAIYQDAEGHYVWKCLNAHVREPLPELLEVSKMRVTPTDRSVPFLGNWVFQAVTVNDEDFDPQSDLFSGEITVDTGTVSEWQGSQVFFDYGGQWMLRPGDVVSVDLTETDSVPGYHVPMEAIYEESGKTYLFVAAGSSELTTAKRLPVEVAGGEGLTSGTVRRVTAASPDALTDGMRIVVGGVHFLNDGDNVRVIQSN